MPIDKPALKKLNSRIISNQCLARSAKRSSSLVEISDALCGVNSQNYSDSYMSYWARNLSFSKDKLDSNLQPGGALSRTWTVRGTVHTFPSKNYNTYVFGSPVERYLKDWDRYAKQLNLPIQEDRVKLIYEPLLDAMGKTTVTTKFLLDFISDRLEEMGIKGRRSLKRGWSSDRVHGPTWAGQQEMSYMGLIANAGRKGSGNLWMNLKHWLGYGYREPDPGEASAKLLLRYIENYGPVTLQDMKYWTGHKTVFLNEKLKEIRSEINADIISGTSKKYYFVDETENDIPKPPHVIVLPRFDSLIMGYYDKSRIMRPQFKDRVSVKAGVIRPTVLLNGFVQAVWKKEIKGKKLRVTVEPFKKLEARDVKAVESGFLKFSEHEELNLEVNFDRPY